ncbi:hypothetical protein BsWGS_01630 [Bradybaena similaris]
MAETTPGSALANILDPRAFDLSGSSNLFALYLGGLFILAYTLSILVAILHLRTESVVYALTRPQSDSFFVEYIILLRTSQFIGSSFDDRGRIQIQLKGSFTDSPLLHLKRGKGMEYFLERGTTNIYVYHSPTVLGDIEQIEIFMVNDAPNEIPFVTWRPSYLCVMQPVTKNWWGCVIDEKMKCTDTLNETFDCYPKFRDAHSILESFCTFHLWLSLFNNPHRFGMYNNLVNVIVIFFIISAMMCITLLDEIFVSDKKSLVTAFTKQKIYTLIFPPVLVLLLEMFIEAIYRNTISRINAIGYSFFHGLMKPVTTTFEVRDFKVNFNWEQVRSIFPQKKVIVPYGSRHPDGMSVFYVEPYHSYFNMWGRLGLDVGRFGNWYFRTLSTCALSLPMSQKWIGIEAKSRKEDMLVRQYISNFTNPMCYFCCWLVDWPLHFFDEPNQAWLIISHIIYADIMSLSKLGKEEYIACLAQICVHQWHGLISCIFLKVIKRSLDNRGVSSSGVSSFIQTKLNRFGRRTAREIQATWRQRQVRLTEMNLKRGAKEQIDENASSISPDREKSLRTNKQIESIICLNCKPQKENSDISDEEDRLDCIGADFYDDYTEDFLDFDVIFSPKNKSKRTKLPEEIGDRHRKKNYTNITAPRLRPSQMPAVSIVEECKLKPRKRKRHSKTNKRPQSYGDSLEVMGIDDVRFHDITGDMYTDMDNKSGPSGFGDTHDTVDNFELGENNNNHTDTNMNADTESETSYIPESAIQHQQKTALLRKIVEQRRQKQLTLEKERLSLPIATYEKYQLGPPFDIGYAMEKDPEHPFNYLRHAKEILAYCDDTAHCRAFSDVHKMVGVTSLEILKKLLKDILYFAMDSESLTDSQKLFKRKKMMFNLFDFMKQKADLYEDTRFKTRTRVEYDGTYCNQLLTSVLTYVEFILGITVNIKKDGKTKFINRKEALYGRVKQQIPRCLFCAKHLQPGVTTNDEGCYDVEKLVRFFTFATIAVAQKEVNIEFDYKYTVQRLCATIVSNAVKDLLVELEDPPLVLACKVTRAMICSQLDKMLPKLTSFKEMTADELRRVGTRRERIQARHDTSVAGNKIETDTEKRKRYIISNLQDQLGAKWRTGLKENDLETCSKLLAQILVHEKIMGFSVYTGFLLKEHEAILGSNRIRLIEIERKAHTAIKKIVRRVILPRMKKALNDSQFVDVMFLNADLEANYIQEALCVMQLNSEGTFLRTCCFYIGDIITTKIEEFRFFAVYMQTFDPASDFAEKLKAKMFVKPFKIDNKELEVYPASSYSSLATPILRWGPSVIKGYAQPAELKMVPYTDKNAKEKFKEKAFERFDQEVKKKVGQIFRTRLKLKSYLDWQKTKKNKELRFHLAQVQAAVTQQVGLLSQSVTSAYALEGDYQREFSRDDLFNVELFATKNLNLLFPTNIGYILTFLLVILTLIMTLVTTFSGRNLTVPLVQKWFFRFAETFLLYGFVFEPLKCLIYVALQLYKG